MMGIAVCKGGLSKGMMMEPKHFAFNHQELNRVGVSTFVTEQAGRENELRGFQGCLAGNYAGGLMTAFNRAGLIYAGSHEGLQVQILRNEWGYDGWIVTDMIGGPNYQQWIGVVFGGGGTCLGSASTYNNSVIGTMESHRAEIEKDTEFQAKMRQAIKYYLHQEVESAAMNGVTVGSSMEYVRTWWQNAFLAFEVCSGILTLLFAALYIRSLRKKNA
jgi:beta-glucosidase